MYLFDTPSLGHADYKSTLRYAKTTHDSLLAAVDAGAKKMQATAAD